MSLLPTTGEKARREYAQLLRFNDRLAAQLQRMREELRSPGTRSLLREIENRTGSAPTDQLAEIVSAVEEAIRTVQLLESTVRNALLEEYQEVAVEGVPDLPPRLGRFLAERMQSPDFTYEVIQDEVRGWVIRWKEMTPKGTVRGSGQFYERPYAWIDE